MTCKSLNNESGISIITGVMLMAVIVVAASAITYAAVNVYDMKQPVIANIEIESVDLSDHQEVVLVHSGGSSFDVSEISIYISVNGETLDNNLVELPVAGGTTGFYGALGGVLWGTPTSQSHDNIWNTGDTGDFRIAKSNRELHPGDIVKVTICHRPSETIISSPEHRI